jgi:hypothetical protein
VNLVQVEFKIQTHFYSFFQTKSNGASMETSEFAMQPCHSNFTLWEAKKNRDFGEFIRFYQTNLDPNKFGPNSKVVLLPGFLIQILLRIWTCCQNESCLLSSILSD